MTPDLTCYGADIPALADRVGDFDLRSPIDTRAWKRVVGKDETICLGVRQRAQQHRSHDGEDGGVGADAQRQGQDGRSRKGSILPEQPERKAEIVTKGVHGVESSRATGPRLQALGVGRWAGYGLLASQALLQAL